MEHIAKETIYAFLAEVGRRYQKSADLYLIGGSALYLLGNPRPTLDIDYIGDDLRKNELQHIIDEVAHDMRLEVDAVPIDGFIPLASESFERRVFVAEFNGLHVYIFDPYAIALSKIDRGFDTDVEDILFLIRRGDVEYVELEKLVFMALEQAAVFGLDSRAMLSHLQAVRNSL